MSVSKKSITHKTGAAKKKAAVRPKKAKTAVKPRKAKKEVHAETPRVSKAKPQAAEAAPAKKKIIAEKEALQQPAERPASAAVPEHAMHPVPPPAPKPPEAVKPAAAAWPAPKTKEEAQKKEAPPVKTVPPIKLEMPIAVGVLAEKIKVRIPELIKTLMGMGIFANVNQLLNEDIVFKAAAVLGIPVERLEDEEERAVTKEEAEDPGKLKLRPPVVTLMGHVDHGKTTLMDAIRKSNVASSEAGQITQHIGAYVVDLPQKGRVTFLDTPGHEAFTAMRARGANVTDVVVLVVAADDGIMPQTREAIDHAQAAGCPIVVAVNKCDLPAADPTRVMTQLQKINLVPEEWGGKTICVKVSGKTGKGIEVLLEMLHLEAEVLELKANPERAASGTVLEAKLTKNQGVVATVLVQNGTLRVGDLLVAGPFYGKVRAMKSDRAKSVKEAGPSYAAEVVGLSGVPEAGELFHAVPDERVARRLAEKRTLEIRERQMRGLQTKHMSLEDLYAQVKEGAIKELNLIIKADVQGSVEALSQSLEQACSEKISIRVIHGGVGGINESDVMLAVASDAIIIGFHVKPNERANALIEKEGVDVRFYSVIYEAIEDVRKAMEGLLEPTEKEVVEGRTEIVQVFSSSKVGTIGGAIVRKGKVHRSHFIRVLRDNVVVHEGKLASLKRFKDDVREVAEGYDCGIVVEKFSTLEVGDVIESYRIEKTAAKLA